MIPVWLADRFARAFPYIAIAFAVAFILAWAHHRGYEAGKSEVQAKWDADQRKGQQVAVIKTAKAQTSADTTALEYHAEVAHVTALAAPKLEDIHVEIAKLPAGSDCPVTDRMREDLNAIRASTDPGARP